MLWIADGNSFLEHADQLVERLGEEEGYRVSERPSNATCLVATEGGSVVATLCVTLGQPFACELTYPDKVGILVASGRKVSEVTRFASNKAGRRLMIGLISAAYAMRIGRVVDDCLIEVNPRHVSFYERIGFRVFGDERLCVRAKAPAVLMRLVLDHAKDDEVCGLQRI